ncbi:MAG TPA: fructose-1,6-bisphosphate aldolase/phosphatase [Gaiellaceae bacterium]|jgi:fructose 1,6-bisphosphate aldolase/phosphatase|nr:fructose-1,6-bisphosphate aldolase/phosphatase [Gaiellaceae bacterium]
MSKVTISAIKADVGGYVGHGDVHPDMIAEAQSRVQEGIANGVLIDGKVGACGDDINLVMTHEHGVDAEDVHKFAWDTFMAATQVAKRHHLYGAGQDLLADSFSGNIRGAGPGVAEIEIEERPSEPIIVFAADKTEPGAWNFPLYKIFADPFNTAGLVIDPKMHAGFAFEVHDLMENKGVFFDCPEDVYDLLVYIGTPSRYVIKHVFRKDNRDEPVAATSTSRLSLIAGRYVGKDDPIMIVRCQSGLPAVGEVVEPFAFPHIVAGWMRGSHHGPLMPCGLDSSQPSRFDGPPRVVGMGFQVADGKLIGPRDMLGNNSFDRARQIALEVTDYMRRMGPFEPERLPLEEMEYTTMPEVAEKLGERWHSLAEADEITVAAPSADVE